MSNPYQWTEDYVIRNGDGYFEFVHVPTQTVLLTTLRVSMETLNGLAREFDTFGEIRQGWREWWDEQYNKS